MGRPPNFPVLRVIRETPPRRTRQEVEAMVQACVKNAGLWVVVAVCPSARDSMQLAGNLRRRRTLPAGVWEFKASHRDHPKHGRQYFVMGKVEIDE